MAVNENVINIADSFKQQIELYSRMLALSLQQLHMLEENGGRIKPDEINVLLLERQKLMETINKLDKSNKQLQREIIRELGLDEFVLTRLENLIDETQYSNLRTLIAKLGELLRTISDQDEQSQLLMRQSLKSPARQSIKAGNEKVSSAYKQAMQQKPPK